MIPVLRSNLLAGAAPAPAPSLAAPNLIGPGIDRAHMTLLARWSNHAETPNIAEELEDDVLGNLGQYALRHYKIDDESRSDWLEMSEKAMKMATMVADEKTFPWPGASNVVYPLLATAATQFAARAYPAIIQGMDVVKGTVYGDDDGVPAVGPDGRPMLDERGLVAQWARPPGALAERAERIGEHMSWQYLEEQPEWEEETDKLLLLLPIEGCAFRKSYFDAAEARKMDVLVRAGNMVVNYTARSLDTAPRATEELKLYPYEIEEHRRSGIFLDQDYGVAPEGGEDEDAPIGFIEQHGRYDIDEDGYREPIVVTVEKQTGKVARIVSRWDMEGIQIAPDGRIGKIDPVHYYTKYDFLPNPDGGFYGMGFGQTLLPLNESVNTTLNQLFDAGTLANTGGGFVGRQLSRHAGTIQFAPGEYKPLNISGKTIRDSIVPLTFPGPSDTLFKLLGFLVEAAKEVSSNTELLSGRQTQANVPASTTLALIEQGLKVFSAVYKRIYRSLKNEFDKGARINRLYMEETADYRRGEAWREIRREDYEAGAIVQPVADPSMVSDMQELARAEALMAFRGDPWTDQRDLRMRVFKAYKFEEPERLLVDELPPNPEVLAKAEELRIKEMAERARALSYMAGAIRDLAEADAVDGETERGWIAMQWEHLKELLDAEQPGAGGPAAGGNPGAVRPMAQPPGNAGLPGLPPG